MTACPRPPARSRLGALVAALVVLVVGGSCAEPGTEAADQAPDTITVAAASDLRLAFTELGEAFTAETGTRVTFSFGSSGLLREQIVNGAPFDLFASADAGYVDDVVEAGVGRADTRTDYALGRLALWSPPGSPLPGSVAELADPRYRRVAIANPDHAPYGRAAEEALRSAGVHDDLEARLVYGENVSDALRIVRSGNADVGLVALPLVVTDDAAHRVVPVDLHRPLRQSLVVVGTGPKVDAADDFADLVTGAGGRAVLRRHGFDLPDATPAGR